MKAKVQALTKASQLKRPRYKREKRVVREVLCVKICLDKREVCNLKTTLGREIYKERTELMAERQNWICGCGCGKSMTDSGFSGATFDHSEGRGMNAGHRDDRVEIDGKPFNKALRLDCNLRKGSRRGYASR